jgi:transposase
LQVPDIVKHKRSKASVLAEDGTLNPAPEKVGDPRFQEDGFFDPRDIVQVKYEMLRRVSVDKVSVTEASDEYGVSRPTFYQARADFEDAGLAGLVPRKRGPRGPHKLQGEVLAFLKAQVAPGEPIRARELTDRIRTRFGLDVHPRTIERALGVKKTA